MSQSLLPAAAIVIASFLAMEAVAWSAHKYIMHGWGWGWHRDHHEPHDGFLERNDLYALVGAAISIGAFSLGSPLVMGERAWWPGTWIGLGVLLYGVVYTLIHDGLVHQRWFRYVPRGDTQNVWCRRTGCITPRWGNRAACRLALCSPAIRRC
jgi:beta-carotene 3-hydroxylase